MACGIYKIINKIDGKIYIGKSKNIKKRWSSHKCSLNNGKDSIHLQRSWNKYGDDKFEFLVEKECSWEELKCLEEYYIELYKSYDRKKGYNIERYSGEGKIVSVETRKRMSKANKGKVISIESRKKSSESHKGLRHTEESRKKISNSHIGKIVSKQTRKKLSDFNKGKHHSEETRKKMSESRRGEDNPKSILTKEKVMEIRQKYIPNEYTIKMLAKEYDVGKTTISHVLKNETWIEHKEISDVD